MGGSNHVTNTPRWNWDWLSKTSNLLEADGRRVVCQQRGKQHSLAGELKSDSLFIRDIFRSRETSWKNGGACWACICLDKFKAGNETVDRRTLRFSPSSRSTLRILQPSHSPRGLGDKTTRNEDFDSFNGRNNGRLQVLRKYCSGIEVDFFQIPFTVR